MGVNRQRRFEGKSDLAIWGGVNHQRRFESKLYRRFEGKSDLAILVGGLIDDLRVNRQTLRVKSDLAISGGGKSSNIFHQVNTFHLLS